MILRQDILNNILLLAEDETWQRSLELSKKGISQWLVADRSKIEHIYLTGCGTSLYAGQVGKYIIEHIAGIPSEAVAALTFSAYTNPTVLHPNNLVVGISTLGESVSAVNAILRAKQIGSMTLAITGNQEGGIVKAAETTISTEGYKDRIPVRTISYIHSLLAIYALAIELAAAMGTLNTEGKKYWYNQIKFAFEGIRTFLAEQQRTIDRLVDKYSNRNKFFILAAGPNIGTAQEASLKLVEMADLYSEGQEVEDFMHGRYWQLAKSDPMFIIAPYGNINERILDLLYGTHNLGLTTVVFTDLVNKPIGRFATDIVQMPGEIDELMTPLMYTVAFYLFDCKLGIRCGKDSGGRPYNLSPHRMKFVDE